MKVQISFNFASHLEICCSSHILTNTLSSTDDNIEETTEGSLYSQYMLFQASTYKKQA